MLAYCRLGSIVLPFTFAAIAAFSSGCSPVTASMHRVKNSTPDTFNQSTRVYTDGCMAVRTYGALYEDTCNIYLSQCRIDGYVPCMEMSKYFAKFYGPIPWRHIPLIYRTSPAEHLLSQVEPRLRALDPRNYSDKWEAVAQQLLVDHGLLKQGESIDDLIEGRIAGAKRSKNKNDKLVILMLDAHYIDDVQQQIENTIELLNSRGLSLIGAEGFNAFDAVPCEYVVHSSEQLACELEDQATVVGLEQPEIYKKHADLARYLEEHHKPSKTSQCKWLEKRIDFEDYTVKRSNILLTHLLDVMNQEKTRSAALIVGPAHLSDFMAMCDALDLSYIAVSVHALNAMLAQYVDSQREDISERLATIDPSCLK